jgi:hypothetical protein
MLAERAQRHLRVVLGGDREQDAAPGQRLDRGLEVDEGLAVRCRRRARCPRARRRRSPRPRACCRDRARGSAATGRAGPRARPPCARRAAPAPRAHRAGGPCASRGRRRRRACRAGRRAARHRRSRHPRRPRPGRGLRRAPRSGSTGCRAGRGRDGRADRRRDRRRPSAPIGCACARTASQTPVQRAASALISSSGASLNGASPSARCSGASTMASGRLARSAEEGSSVALKYWPKSGSWMSSATPRRAAASRRSGAKVAVVQVATSPTRSRRRSRGQVSTGQRASAAAAADHVRWPAAGSAASISQRAAASVCPSARWARARRRQRSPAGRSACPAAAA